MTTRRPIRRLRLVVATLTALLIVESCGDSNDDESSSSESESSTSTTPDASEDEFHDGDMDESRDAAADPAPDRAVSASAPSGYRSVQRVVDTVTLDHVDVQFTCEVTFRFRIDVGEQEQEHTVRVFTQEAGDRRIPQLRLSEIQDDDKSLSREMLEALELRTNDIVYYANKVDYSSVACHDLEVVM